MHCKWLCLKGEIAKKWQLCETHWLLAAHFHWIPPIMGIFRQSKVFRGRSCLKGGKKLGMMTGCTKIGHGHFLLFSQRTYLTSPIMSCPQPNTGKEKASEIWDKETRARAKRYNTIHMWCQRSSSTSSKDIKDL